MSIPPRFTAELRDRVTLSELIGRRVKLVRAGREYKGCCPFHHEKSPSFYVNDDKQFYHCFGCGAHGDAIGFVMQHDNLSFIEAVEILAGQAGMQVPEQTPQEIARAQEEKGLHSLMDETTRFFEKTLRESGAQAALGYLHGRGMNDELLTSFRIGFAPADGQLLRAYLKQAGYTDAQMLEAGVIRKSERGKEPYAFFRDRIMFPVADRRGRVVAFGGRILPDHLRPPDTGDFKPPKYINSSDTPLFHKGQMLYSASRARQAAAEGKPVIVVEGYVDVMACCQAGFTGAVAPLGTALTEEQILVLWKLIPSDVKIPILSFDGDNAGRRAAARACERILPLLKPDHSVKLAFLPEGQDPDSLLRASGKKAFEAILDTAMSLVDFMWLHHTGGRALNTPEAKAGLSKTLMDEVARIADREVQQYYKQAFRDKLYALGRSEAPSSKGKGRKAGPAKTPTSVKPVTHSGEALRHMMLLAAVINHPEIIGSIEEELGQMPIWQERLDLLRQAVLNLLGTDLALDGAGLCTHLTQRGFGDELAQILSERVYTHGRFARPSTPVEEVLEQWQETWRFIQQQSVGKELRDAGQALAHDLSPENEQKWQALHDMHKAAGDS